MNPFVHFLDTREVRSFSPERMQKVSLFESEHIFCDLYCLEPGQHQRIHRHDDATKFYYVVEGRGSFTVGHRIEVLGPGGLAFALPGEPHGVDNTGDSRLVILVAMGPNPNRKAPA